MKEKYKIWLSAIGFAICGCLILSTMLLSQFPAIHLVLIPIGCLYIAIAIFYRVFIFKSRPHLHTFHLYTWKVSIHNSKLMLIYTLFAITAIGFIFVRKQSAEHKAQIMLENYSRQVHQKKIK